MGASWLNRTTGFPTLRLRTPKYLTTLVSMPFSCFRASGGNRSELDDLPQAARHVAKKSASRIRRVGSGDTTISSTSTTSNESISRLPPCPRASDPKVEAMMMPLPHDSRPSRCLRLSHPRVYGNLVTDMKASKGCRDWRNFAVFYDDDVDMSMSADEAARKKAIEYQRMLRKINCSFESSPRSDISSPVDMIG